MTAQKNLKSLIRARMARTGESYTTARRHLLARRGEPAPTPRKRGVHPDSAALAQVFAACGLPHDEALLFGLGGGAGFLSFVFEYAGHPPMYTAVMRRWSMSHAFGQRALERAGIGVQSQTTGGAKSAAKHLDAALAAGRPFVCVADLALLPHHGLSPQWKGTAPQVVGVFPDADAPDDALTIEDHGRRHIERAAFAEARAGYRKAKHALYRLGDALDEAALATGIRAALADCAEGLLDPQMGHFQNNFGVRGIRTLAEQLTDARTKKGMPRRFAAHQARLLGRLYACVRLEWSGAAALRHLYADFLTQASARLGIALPVAAFRESGDRWEAFAQAAVADLPDVKAAIDAQVDALWAGEGRDALVAKRAAVEAAFERPAEPDDTWARRLADLAEHLPPIADLEARAAQAIRAALG